MLNIGRLSPGAADYYVGEVATSAEDYYTGRGETAGRWAGSLADRLGLKGTVEPEQFRRVLDGQHPHTGEQLARPRVGRQDDVRRSSNPDQGSLFEGVTMDLPRVAARLRVGVRRVRQLVWAGDRGVAAPDKYLRAAKMKGEGRGRPAWRVETSEVERFAAAREASKARPGYDLTLRPPKSVSVIWALAPDPIRSVIRQAHAEAVNEVVAYIETHALSSRKRVKNGGRDRIQTDGVIAAVFDHRTSRAGDPLLHSHVVTANLTKTVEGRWVAIDGRPLFAHARPAGMLYQAHLRHLLTERLGVDWGDVRNGWAEIEGVPREVIRAFSKRRDEIEEMVAESGYTSARAHQTATLSTRRAKEYGVDPDKLVERWRSEAAELGFGPTDVDACLQRVNRLERSDGQGSAVDGQVREGRLFAALGGPDGLTRMASTFTRRDVVAAVSEWAGATLPARDIDRIVDRFIATDQVVGLVPDPKAGEWVWRRGGIRERDVDLVRFSTPELATLEADLREWAFNGLGETQPAVPEEEIVDGVIAARPALSPEQALMVRALASADAAAIQPISGRPGSGKTFATATYVKALALAGVPVVGCALAATAAAELEASCDFGTLTGREASTVARLLRRLAREPLPAGAVVIVDEASMIGTRDLHRLVTHTARAGGTIKLIGDPRQHGAVETGGFFRHLCDAAGDSLVRLEANNRQTSTEDRTTVDEYRAGMVEAAVARYDAAGRVHRFATARDAYDGMARDWYETIVERGGRDPMIAGPNRVRRELNRRARVAMTSSGRLAGTPLVVADGLELQEGDWIVTRRNDPRLKAGHGRGWVKNGSAGIVASLDHERHTATITFDREGTITLPAEYIDTPGHVEHGYARTTYGVQGATLERALYFAGDEASFEEGYVAFTRGRTETRLYLVDGAVDMDDPDSSHRAHDVATTGLDTVTAAMANPRANELVHDADPHVASVIDLGGLTLADLRIERLRLETILRAGPPDVTSDIDDTNAERDAILARRQATIAGTARRDKHRRLAGLYESLQHLDDHLADLVEQQGAHQRHLDLHAVEAAAYPTVRRAELAREITVRAQAAGDPPAAAIAALGPLPPLPTARRAWRDAAEQFAIHLERYGFMPADSDKATEQALGGRPSEFSAAFSYDRAVDALRAARTYAEAQPERRPDLELDVEPDGLALFD